MSITEFCEWLGIARNTYRRIITENINQICVPVYLNIYNKTGMYFCDLHPKNELCKIVKK